MARGVMLMLALLVAAPPAQERTPITFGETFTLHSKVLSEERRVNVYIPPSWDEAEGAARPVVYMPDGGMAEDFLHIAGLLQVSVGNGTMRPFILVGIENTQRRRDMTGPTEVAEDRKIAPVVGGSAAFRQFIRDELMPVIDARYKTTSERAIVGESLAGLFVVETMLMEPAMFDTYIAFDPSLWWNASGIVKSAPGRLENAALNGKRLRLAVSSNGDRADAVQAFSEVLKAQTNVAWTLEVMPGETHATIYHPAALDAFRMLFKPEAK